MTWDALAHPSWKQEVYSLEKVNQSLQNLDTDTDTWRERVKPLPPQKKAEKMWEFTPCREILPPSSIYSLGSSLKELIHQRGRTTTGNFQVPSQAFPREAHQVRGASYTYRASRQLRGTLPFCVNRLAENIMLEGSGVKLWDHADSKGRLEESRQCRRFETRWSSERTCKNKNKAVL